MFGSLKINGTKISKQVRLNEAVTGFLILDEDTNYGKIGDCLLKILAGNGYMCINISSQYPCPAGVNPVVKYADVELNYTPVEK